MEASTNSFLLVLPLPNPVEQRTHAYPGCADVTMRCFQDTLYIVPLKGVGVLLEDIETRSLRSNQRALIP